MLLHARSRLGLRIIIRLGLMLMIGLVIITVFIPLVLSGG